MHKVSRQSTTRRPVAGEPRGDSCTILLVQLRLVGTLGKPLAIVLGGRPPPVVRCLNTEPQPQVVTSDSSLARRFYQFCLFLLHFRQKSRKLAFYYFKTLSQWFSDSHFENSPIVKDQPSETHKSGQKLKLLAPKVPIVTHVLQAVIEKLRLV